ncbi:MAG TPA: carboxypeptidase-like regulatory domain-containing protein [Gemmatimonadota bacterium]|nr:carboxypeptidase-like regulatory domain-containing protein [Gemmatimonadota bacterium]
MNPIARRASGPLAFLLALALTACSESNAPSGPDDGSPSATRITGQLIAGGDLAAAVGISSRGLGLSANDALAGVKITVVDENGNEILSTTTDLEGEFDAAVPAGTYTIFLEVDPETQFTFTIDVPEGTTFFVRGEVDVNPSGKFTLDAEIFVDNDGDGEPDSSFVIQITGRVAGQPQSGDVNVQGGEDRVAVCHFPPGNPENFHTIFVGPAAVPAHLAHGDTEGPCEGDEDPGDNGEDNGDNGEDNGDNGEGEKATICHIPPGRPENARTLQIDPDDVEQHLAHGDHEGPCEGDEENGEGNGE